MVGANATGKTNLLEAAWFALRGSSPRTRREEKLITWGQRFSRVELDLDGQAAGPQAVEVGFAPGQGKRVRWSGLEVASLDELRGRSQVFVFVPESLLLIKGSPARRRAHIDAFAASLDPQYAAAASDVQSVLRQRNAQLAMVKHGADPAALDPWDVQFARAATALGRRRRDLVDELARRFSETAAALAPTDAHFTLRLVAQLDSVGYDEAALLDELRARRPGEVRRGLSLFGPHRDDLRFLEVGADPWTGGGWRRLPGSDRDRGGRCRSPRSIGHRDERTGLRPRRSAPWRPRLAPVRVKASSARPCWRYSSASSDSPPNAPASREHSSWTM